ncbi:tetratricopeptide repeat protein [candidate division KSB1 bacterium]|nr:tetratricopeptide repeat protein [candidate division KSB1 bacterium]
MKMKGNVMAKLLSVFTAFLISCQPEKVGKEFNQAKAMLLEVSMKADSAGMVQARQRFEKLLENPQAAKNDSLAAWAHYFIAFANWQMAFVTYGNTEGAKKTANDAVTHLQTATKLRANLVDAYVVLRRCYFWQYLLDPKIGMAGWRESATMLQKAKEFAPENPRVIFEEAIDWFYKPPQAGGDRQKGLARFQEAVQRFEQMPKQEAAYENWWHATTYMYLGQAYLGVEKPEEAEKAFKKALALQPNFSMVKNSMLPMTEEMTVPAVRNLDHVAWKQLTADPANDGRNPNWAEAKALSFYYDAPTDTLWFKFDLERLPNPNAFGLNLIVDTDQNQQTGASWWGNNKTFKYDRLVTVWVIKTGPNRYRGSVGIGDTHGIQLGRYTNLFQNNLAFHADAEKKIFLLGFKSAELDNDGRFDLMGEVGSNVGWNDDVPDSSFVTLSLK